MTEHITCEKNGPVWRIKLNRPHKANALTSAMLASLADTLSDAAQDRDLRALHLTGAGEKVFSAGADLAEIGDNAGAAYFAMWESVASALAETPLLTIAALNGACMGGGLVLASACDIRVAAPHARFAYPILKNGITPGIAQTERLRQLIGPARAAMLVLGAARFDAEEALSIGLIERIVDDPLAVANELSEAAMTAGREHLGTLKSLMATGRLPQ